MGLINKLFGSSNKSDSKRKQEEKILPWQALTKLEQLDVIKERSKTKTQLVFKHSTRCGISRMVLNQFTATYNLDLDTDLYYLDLLNYRDVSNEVGYTFQVMHQSPQLLIIKNGNTVAHASHGGINEIDLEQVV